MRRLLWFLAAIALLCLLMSMGALASPEPAAPDAVEASEPAAAAEIELTEEAPESEAETEPAEEASGSEAETEPAEEAPGTEEGPAVDGTVYYTSGTGVYTVDDCEYTWTLTEDGVLTIGGTGELKKLPHDYDFSYIEDDLWYGIDYDAEIKTLVVGPGFTSLGKDIMDFGHVDHVDKIQTVRLPGSVETIGVGAFRNHPNLKKVYLPYGLKTIRENAFYECSGLTEIEIPATVETIEEEAFRGCTSLTEVTVPYTVESLGDWAFAGCTGLRAVTADCGSTGKNVFSGCIMLEDASLNCGNVGVGMFNGCKKLEKAVMGDNVKSIDTDAFNGCISLEDVSIGKNVEIIGGRAFKECVILREIDIPEGVTSIWGNAFEGCTELASVIVPDSVTGLGSEVFMNCPALKTVVIGDGVPVLWESVFWNCTALESVTLGSGVKEIHKFAFYNCSSLPELTLPDSLIEVIGPSVAKGCDSLKTLTVGAGLSAEQCRRLPVKLELTTLENICVSEDNPELMSADGVVYSRDGTELIMYPMGRTDTAYMVRDGVTAINDRAFYAMGDYYDAPLQSITLPGTLTDRTGSSDPFYYLDQLTDIYFQGPESVFQSRLEEGLRWLQYEYENDKLRFHFQETAPVDLNGDGCTDRQDRRILALRLAGREDIAAPEETAADLNGDGAVDRLDRIKLARALAEGAGVVWSSGETD